MSTAVGHAIAATARPLRPDASSNAFSNHPHPAISTNATGALTAHIVDLSCSHELSSTISLAEDDTIRSCMRAATPTPSHETMSTLPLNHCSAAIQCCITMCAAEYAKRINTQIVHPAQSVVVKPDNLELALSQPVLTSTREPHRIATYLGATLSVTMMKGNRCTLHLYWRPANQPFMEAGQPFREGNKRTGSVPSFVKPLTSCQIFFLEG
ncbi:hypothetical protein BC834DRAFT_345828 [Gloeopeniophorella convolvens]|nr:hypothetical protein BC834DRAFT_345828 [Gloeopeniophorella convolvens]